VKAHVRGALVGGESRPVARGAAIAGVPLPDFTKWGATETKPMSNIRRKTAEHLSAAWATIPHVTQNDKADVTAIEQFRKAYGKKVEAAGGKLTVTAILIKIVAMAIDKYPQFASSVDMANEALIYKGYRHIGFAVDTPNGLLVPVIKNADEKNLLGLSRSVADLAARARSKKLNPEEVQGGTFTITNPGIFGALFGLPIISQPQVAILGVGTIDKRVVVVDDDMMAIRPMCYFTLGYDHRLVDGADAGRFLARLKQRIQDFSEKDA